MHFIKPTTGIALCATLSLILAGCGDSGGGGGGSGGSKGVTGSGSGADVSGYFHAAITSVGGVWASSKYVMNGAVFMADLTITGVGEIELDGPNGPFTLTYDAGKYVGEITYLDGDSASPFNGTNVTETWTVWQKGGKVYASVSAVNDAAAPLTAKATATMYEPFFAGNLADDQYYGTVTSSNPAVWNKGSLAIWSQSWANPDLLYFGRDNYYWEDIDVAHDLYRDGTMVKGAGYGSNSEGDDLFATCTLSLAGSGEPASGSLTVYNYDKDRNESLAFNSVHSDDVLGSIIGNLDLNEYDFAITSMTAGGNLATIFPSYDAAAPLTHTYAYDEGYGMEFWDYSFDMYFEDTGDFGELSSQWPAWNGGTVWQFVDYDPDAGGDYPYYNGPEEYSYQVTLSFDPVANVFTGGTLKLYDVSASGSISGAETLNFTFSAPRPNITSSLTANGTQGAAFTYNTTATRSPTSYGATGLPTGLAIDAGTGAITGTPTVSGTFNVTLTASNASGTDTETLVITLAVAP